MLKRITFGNYVYKNSMIHNLDARLKILYVVLLSTAVFFIDAVDKIFIFSFFILIIILMSRLSLSDLLNGLRPFVFIFAFVLAMYLLFSRNQIQQGIITIWRFLMLIIISLILTFTTSTSNLITAIEKLAKPLKVFNFKPRNIAVMISLTVRFVPEMFLRLERLKEAMLARLANFRKLKHLRLLMLALLEKLFSSASSLSDAMHSRLYDENVENKRIFRMQKNDYISVIFILLVIFLIY